MAYEKQTWVDREVTYPMRFIMTENSDGTVTLEPYTGLVSNEGTSITAARMNHIEDGISSIDNRVETLETTNKDIKVLVGTITTPNANASDVVGFATVSYPMGYNKENCMIIGLMGARKDDGTIYTTPMPISASGYILGTSGLAATLMDDNISIRKQKTDSSEPSTTTNFKIALLKIL